MIFEFTYALELSEQDVKIEVTDYTPYLYGGRDEPTQHEAIEFDVWQNGELIASERDVTKSEREGILKLYKDLNDIA